jgi:Zn-dependent peptidase ImmA (M78 family)
MTMQTETTRHVEALVKPELLIWARKSAGYASHEKAVAGLAIKAEQLAEWERGGSRPSIPQLRKLAGRYKRPLAVFYLPTPPKDFEALHDYRRLPGEFDTAESPALRLEIRKARYRRQVALELLRALDEEPVTFALRATRSEDPDTVAARARAALGITIEDQVSWRDPYTALNAWRAALERLGILVFQATGIERAEMRGFSIAEWPLPAVAVNVKDQARGRIFTLLHELVHLMLREEGLCDLREDRSLPAEEQRTEVFCNRVAGAILLPREALLNEPTVAAKPIPGTWTDAELDYFVRRYQGSSEAVLRRLLILGKTTEAFYRRKREEFLAFQEPPGNGFLSQDKKPFVYAGAYFTRLVLDSYYRDRITSSDLADYLEVRLKHLPKIEERVLQGQLAAATA